MSKTSAKRIFAWVVGMLVGLPLLAYLALVAINWNDEPPSADVERLIAMNHDRPVLADAANGHVHAVGLVPDADADYRTARSPGVAALASACGEAPACAEALDANPEALARWLASEQWLLERYRRMLAAEGWREPIPEDPGVSLPPYQHAMGAQKLHLLDAWRQAVAGDPAAVRDLLERDLVFWRQVLASSDLLITKMIAVAATGRNFEFGNLALRELPAGLVDAAVPPSWREPLTVAERSIARSLGGEWHFVASALRAGMSAEATEVALHERIAERLLRPLYQEQATLNLAAARTVQLGTLSELPWPELGPALERLSQPEEQGQVSFQPYNPIGSILDSTANLAAAAYGDYIGRAADLEGQRRATLLVATLRGAGTGPEGAAAAVRDAALRSPYDDAPFEWDAASGSVVFRGLGQGDRGRHAVPL